MTPIMRRTHANRRQVGIVESVPLVPNTIVHHFSRLFSRLATSLLQTEPLLHVFTYLVEYVA